MNPKVSRASVHFHNFSPFSKCAVCVCLYRFGSNSINMPTIICLIMLRIILLQIVLCFFLPLLSSVSAINIDCAAVEL